MVDGTGACRLFSDHLCGNVIGSFLEVVALAKDSMVCGKLWYVVKLVCGIAAMRFSLFDLSPSTFSLVKLLFALLLII